MKKKTLIFALLASVFVGTLASCNVKNNDAVTINSRGQEVLSNQTPKNLVEDNDSARNIFAVFEKTFSNATYEDFLIYCDVYDNSEGLKFYHYLSGYVTLDSNGLFKSKIIYNDNKRTESLYINNEWVKKIEEENINGTYETIYLLKLNQDNTFDAKIEYTYDESGKLLTEIHYSYQNGEWVLQKQD